MAICQGTEIDSIQDTTSQTALSECHEAFNVVVNAEDYWHESAKIRGIALDSCRTALTKICALNGIVIDSRSSMFEIVKNTKALDESTRLQIAGLTTSITELERSLKKQTRKKKFWKTVAAIELVALPVITIILLK